MSSTPCSSAEARVTGSTVPATARGIAVLGALLATVAVLSPRRAAAQQSQLDVHGSFAEGTQTHTRSWGGGVGVQGTFGGTSAPVNLSVSPGLDYMKQENSGPSQTSVSLDVAVQPGGGGSVTPYVGGSASANWSGGSGKQWEGAKLGMETMAGVQVKLGSNSKVSLKGEERFGYVTGQEHTLTTRAGVLVSL